MATRGFSRYHNLEIQRKRIFEPRDVEIGYEFILRLVTLRLMSEESRPATKEERLARFKEDKNKIAEQMGYDSYVALPKDAKGFESRCAVIQKLLPSMKYSDIARFEKAFNERVSAELFESVMEPMCYHAQERKFSEEERRWNLMRRTCCLNIPFVFKPKEEDQHDRCNDHAG